MFKYRWVNGTSINNIINITWNWEGSSTGGGNVTLYIFNDSNDNWSIFNSTISGTDFNLIYFTNSTSSIRTEIFNSSNYTHIIAKQRSLGGTIGVSSDFVKMTIVYDDLPPTFTNIRENESYAIAVRDINFSATVSDDFNISYIWHSHNFDLNFTENFSNNGASFANTFGNSSWIGQTFKFNSDRYLGVACFNISNNSVSNPGSPRRNITIEVRNTVQRTPTGSNLTTKYQIDTSRITNSFQPLCVNFTKPVVLTGGVKYLSLIHI